MGLPGCESSPSPSPELKLKRTSFLVGTIMSNVCFIYAKPTEIIWGFVGSNIENITKTYECIDIQVDQKVSVHLTITVQNTHKNILNTFNHLP
jgi:hypothetical protein